MADAAARRSGLCGTVGTVGAVRRGRAGRVRLRSGVRRSLSEALSQSLGAVKAACDTPSAPVEDSARDAASTATPAVPLRLEATGCSLLRGCGAAAARVSRWFASGAVEEEVGIEIGDAISVAS